MSSVSRDGRRVQPAPQDADELVRLLEVDDVAGIGDDRERGVGNLCRHPLGDRHELLVEGADDEKHRHRGRTQSGPQRVLGTGAGEAQARRQPGGGVLQTGCPLRRVVRQVGEQRRGQPLVEEGGDTSLLDLGRSLLVLDPADGALVVVVDAGRRADEDESLDEVGSGNGEVQCQAAPHRVPDVGGPLSGVAEQRGAGRKVDTQVRCLAVTRCVGRDDLEAFVAEAGGRWSTTTSASG